MRCIASLKFYHNRTDTFRVNIPDTWWSRWHAQVFCYGRFVDTQVVGAQFWRSFAPPRTRQVDVEDNASVNGSQGLNSWSRLIFSKEGPGNSIVNMSTGFLLAFSWKTHLGRLLDTGIYDKRHDFKISLGLCHITISDIVMTMSIIVQ